MFFRASDEGYPVGYKFIFSKYPQQEKQWAQPVVIKPGEEENYRQNNTPELHNVLVMQP